MGWEKGILLSLQGNKEVLSAGNSLLAYTLHHSSLLCTSTHTCCNRLGTLILHGPHLPHTSTLGLMHVAPTHLCFLHTQHGRFGLVVEPKSEMGFVKEILGWPGWPWVRQHGCCGHRQEADWWGRG